MSGDPGSGTWGALARKQLSAIHSLVPVTGQRWGEAGDGKVRRTHGGGWVSDRGTHCPSEILICFHSHKFNRCQQFLWAGVAEVWNPATHYTYHMCLDLVAPKTLNINRSFFKHCTHARERWFPPKYFTAGAKTLW